MKLEELYAKRDELLAAGQEIVARLDGQLPEGEDDEKLRSLAEEVKAVNKDIANGEESAATVGDFEKARADADASRDKTRPPLYAGGGTQDSAGGGREEFDARTPGERFVESEVYAAWKARFPGGGPSKGEAHSDALEVGVYRDLLGLRTATDRIHGVLTAEKARTLITSSDTSAGDLVLSLRRGLIEPGLVRPLTIRDLVTVLQVTTDTIEYVQEKSRVSAAAMVAEASALTGTSGTKPEGGLVFEPKSDTVKTIAEWVPATKRILADAGQLRGYIDEYLTYDVALELEDQMMSGDGTGENFLGILNEPTIQTQIAPVAPENMLDVIRFAKRKIMVNARTVPNAVVINPEDMELIDTLKASITSAGVLSDVSGTGGYYGSNPFSWSPNTRLWGMTLVESEAVPAKTALVGDFRRAVLFDRESTAISVGTCGDDFIRNIVRVLAEMRAGFGVIRPTAFCATTLRA